MAFYVPRHKENQFYRTQKHQEGRWARCGSHALCVEVEMTQVAGTVKDLSLNTAARHSAG